MSRPVLLSAPRRLPLVPHYPRSFSTSRTVLNCFSASSDPSTSRQPAINNPPLHISRRSRPSRYSACRASVSPFAGSRQHAAFSSSTVRPSAKITQNEKKDEEGKVLMVGISSRAAEVSLVDFCLFPFQQFRAVDACKWACLRSRGKSCEQPIQGGDSTW